MTEICRILIVEDNAGIRELLHTLFDDEGYDITLAADGRQMRGAVATGSFDLALIDITLPGRDDGFELAAAARDAGMAVILVTGDSRHYQAIEASGHPFLLKPFRVERLLALVTEVLESHAPCHLDHSGAV
jgi:two-component system, OmpR family, response regulator